MDRQVDISVREFGMAALRLGGTKKPDTLGLAKRREILDVMIDKAVLARRAARESWTWTREESTQAKVMHDRLTLAAALDSAENTTREERRVRGESILTGDTLGMATRDTFVARQRAHFDVPLLRRVAVAFDTMPKPDAKMPIYEQMRLAGAVPVIADGDMDLPLVTSASGVYTVRELVESWGRLNPIYRPRVATEADVADLARNGLFERALRRNAAAQRLVERPDIAAELAEQREYFAITHYVQREVYARIPTDSVTLKKHYAGSLSKWDMPPKAKTLEMELPDRASANAMMERIRNGVQAESLMAQAQRAGTSFVNEASPYGDSMIFVYASKHGPGAVLGPDSTLTGFRIIRVLSLIPSRHRTFAEARSLVEKDWVDLEAERRMRLLLGRLRTAASIVVNERVLKTAKLPDAPPGVVRTVTSGR